MRANPAKFVIATGHFGALLLRGWFAAHETECSESVRSVASKITVGRMGFGC